MDKSGITSLAKWEKFRFRLLFYSIIVGACTGIVVIIYRYIIDQIINFTTYIQSLHLNVWILGPIWLLILTLICFMIQWLTLKYPIIAGSGIPQVEGELENKISMDWKTTLIGKFIGGILSIGAGLSLGREGPSIQLGGAIGKGVAKLTKRMDFEEKYLITAGASAGLSAAFSAPLSGAFFSLEEVHKNFSPLIFLSAMSASLTAGFLTQLVLGTSPLFDFGAIKTLPLSYYWCAIIIGALVGVCGVFYNKTLLSGIAWYKKLTWIPLQIRPIIPFVLATLFAFVLPEVLGGGNPFINALPSGNYTLYYLGFILIVKFYFSIISYSSGVPGGIFFPLLALGSIIGAMFGLVFTYVGVSDAYTLNFIVMAMSALFSAVVRAPLTGMILVVEMSGNLTNLVPLAIAALSAYVVAGLFRSEPIYESLLDLLLGKKVIKGKDEKKKTIIETAVMVDSYIDHKYVHDLQIPQPALLVGIRRGENEIIPNGTTQILAGDFLIVFVTEKEAPEADTYLLSICTPPEKYNSY